jgi:hypothetical protein
MRKPRLFLSSAICLSISLCASAQRVDTLEATHRLNWPESVADIPRANRIPQEEVARFLNSFRGQEKEPTLRPQEFRFAPIERGRIGLAATVDASGRDLFYAVVVILPEGTRFRRTILPSAPPHFLAREVVDLTGDGIDEVITKEPVAGYQGAQTDPIFWWSIFEFRHGLPKDVSASFPEFYQRVVLPDLGYLEQLLALVRERDPRALRFQQAEVEFLRLKVRRKIFGEERAGLQEAIAWTETGDARLQELAIRALEEISGPQSLKKLEQLARSSDPLISQRANNALTRLRERGQ